jgi:hypothetical protein
MSKFKMTKGTIYSKESNLISRKPHVSELLALLKNTFGNPLAFFTVKGGKNYMPYSVRVLFICKKCF